MWTLYMCSDCTIYTQTKCPTEEHVMWSVSCSSFYLRNWSLTKLKDSVFRFIDWGKWLESNSFIVLCYLARDASLCGNYCWISSGFFCCFFTKEMVKSVAKGKNIHQNHFGQIFFLCNIIHTFLLNIVRIVSHC